jgi:hypothetical protein
MSTSGDGYFTDGYFSGARLLATDARIALLLAREARDRACERYLGISRADANMATLIGLATLAHVGRGKMHNAITAAGGPTRNDSLIGLGLLNEAVHEIAGDWSREVPVLPALILAAVIAHHLRPWARVSLHDLRAMSHRLRGDLEHRYGHLIRPTRRGADGSSGV